MSQITIRSITREDAGAYVRFYQELDAQTANLMLEPAERPKTVALQEAQIAALLSTGDGFLVAAENGAIVGFLMLARGRWARTRHSASLAMGILRSHQRRGLGLRLMAAAERWAFEHGVTRLELTVRTDNASAIALYEKCGFTRDGRRPRSLLIAGIYVDELYMSRLLA